MFKEHFFAAANNNITILYNIILAHLYFLISFFIKKLISIIKLYVFIGNRNKYIWESMMHFFA